MPGTAVFGTKGGLTGVLAEQLQLKSVAETLRSRRTFATTGERLVGVVSTQNGEVLQGDEAIAEADEDLTFDYGFYGNAGFSAIEAWDSSGRIFHRDLQKEASARLPDHDRRKLRVKWGGARLYDRYREAVWYGSILVSGAMIESIQPFGGVVDNPEDTIGKASETQVIFKTRTSGDFDGVDIFFSGPGLPSTISVTGNLGGYVKVGNPLSGNPHKTQPQFNLDLVATDEREFEGKEVAIAGGADLFVSAEVLTQVELPRKVKGTFTVQAGTHKVRDQKSVYFVGREHTGGKVITSPMFIEFGA